MKDNSEQELFEKLVLSREAILYDASARAFFMCLLRGDNVYSVIDQMLSHYTRIEKIGYETAKQLGSTKDELRYLKATIADQAKEIEELKIACKWKQTQIEDLLNQQKDNSPF